MRILKIITILIIKKLMNFSECLFFFPILDQHEDHCSFRLLHRCGFGPELDDGEQHGHEQHDGEQHGYEPEQHDAADDE